MSLDQFALVLAGKIYLAIFLYNYYRLRTSILKETL